MIGRFLTFLVVFVVAAGLILHFKAEVPFISSWIGKLPGDLVIKKHGMTIFLPLTTAGILSVLCTLIFSSKSQS